MYIGKWCVFDYDVVDRGDTSDEEDPRYPDGVYGNSPDLPSSRGGICKFKENTSSFGRVSFGRIERVRIR